MSAESRERLPSDDSEVMEVTAEGVAKHRDEMIYNVKVEAAQNNSNSTAKEENNVFDFLSSSDEWQPRSSNEGMKTEAVNSGGGKRLFFANQIATTGEKLARRKLKMRQFPLSGIQVFKQVLYGKESIILNLKAIQAHTCVQ